jgi:iron complex outermembrane receptor protein
MFQIVLFCIVFLFCFIFPAFAQEKEKVLEEIVVTATKTEREVKEIPTNITVITEEDIKKYEARDVSELLRQISGFNISYFGGVHADIYVSSRGQVPLTRGAQILVDGIEYNNPSGYFNALAIPIENIDKIEIIKSPATSLYGNFATGGVINVITKRPQKPFEGKLSFSGGSFDTQKYSVLLTGVLKNLEYNLEMRYFKTHGYQENSWEDNKLLNLKLKYNLNHQTNIGLHFNYAPIENGYPGTLTKKEFQENPRQTTQPRGKADSYTYIIAPYFEKIFSDSRILFKIKYGYQDGWVIDPDYFEFANYNIVPEFNYTISHNIGDIKGILLIGAEYRYLNNEKIKAYSFDGSTGIIGPLYQDRTWKDKTFALFFQEELEIMKNLFVSFGTRYDRVDTDFRDKIKPSLNFSKNHSVFSPKIGISYLLSDSLNIFANYSHGFRNPTTAITGFANNPDLKPEKIKSYELGLRGQPLKWFYYSGALFIIDTKDKIVRIGGLRRVENAGETISKGIEFNFTVDLQNGFYSSMNYTYQDSKYKEYTTVAGTSYKDKRIPLVPSNILGISIGYKSYSFGKIDLISNYTDKKYIDSANMESLGDHLIIDVKYTRQIGKNMDIFLSGKNLTNKKYAEVGFVDAIYPMPGRSIMAGINLNF